MTESIQLEPNDTVLCLYHNDPDGQCAAAIVRRKFGKDVDLEAMDYGIEIPWEKIRASSVVFIVDFSLPLVEMLRIQENARLIWIDHHKTALEALRSLDVPGLRALDRAGCVLTWQTLYPDLPLPRAVRYIGERDIWTFEHQETRPFCEGLYQMSGHPSNDQLWDRLLVDEEELVQQMIQEGILLLRARKLAIRRQVHGYAYEIEFEGHRTLAINARGTGELGEHIRALGYAMGYAYVEMLQNGQLKTSVTLYSDQIDASEIAKRFGGGGHAGAAGFAFASHGAPFPEGASVRIKQGDN
ncbi:MAG: hypothetical protein JXA97_01330 [Anaerolineales bacterium]|nr:hypothetical protein [Anaerolineales bacterium]